MLHIHHVRYFVVPFLLGSILFEVAWYSLVQQRAYPWREMAASIGVYFLRMPMILLRPLIVAPLALLAWEHRFFTVPLNTAWGWLLLFLCEQLAYYWMHRSAHEVRFMWASHVVHHTPEHIHLASAFRLGATELFSGSFLFYIPLYLLGFHPLAVSLLQGINLAYQFWLHTDLIGRLGPIEWIFNTPSHHRVHHASNACYVDRNYGGILIMWDRVFGTFASERREIRIRYGLVHPLGSLNPFRIAFHEWIAIARDLRSAGSGCERLRQLFGRPGYSRSGAGQAPHPALAGEPS
jgi:sterol desaturase/sphingolipid hydroxylase (fatty acid hydroxylase superfamily)